MTLPEPFATQLEQLAAATGDPPGRAATQLLRAALGEGAKAGSAPTHASPVRRGRSTALAPRCASGRAPEWLPPLPSSPRWRAEMWSAIVDLHRRYTRELDSLEAEWWRHSARAEVLCALVTWRARLDAGADDPREELAFQAQLADFARILKATPGVGARRFQPTATPAREWLLRESHSSSDSQVPAPTDA